MAEESKNEYAAQLQRFNRDQAHFYFSQMPQIFDVSAPSPPLSPRPAQKKTTQNTPVNHLLHICQNPSCNVLIPKLKGVLETNSSSELCLLSSCSFCQGCLPCVLNILLVFLSPQLEQPL